MQMNILFLTCVAAITVSGQFLDTEYSPYSVPLPVKRIVNGAQYEGQQNIGQYEAHQNIGRETEFRTEAVRISNQGRRHIENSPDGNIYNGQMDRNVGGFEIEPYENDHRQYEAGPAGRRTNYNGRQQEYSEYQSRARTHEPNQENDDRPTNAHYDTRNNENINLNHRNNGDAKLKTNLDISHYQPNNSTNQNLKIDKTVSNQQNQRVYGDSRQNEPRTNINNKNLAKTSQNEDNQPNHASGDNVRINNNPFYEQAQNSRNIYNNENVNNNRRSEASFRAIDSNSYSQQNTDLSNNNRNYNTKHNGKNAETSRENINRNYESSLHTTEPTRITVYDKSVTGRTKSTEDNELASKSHPEGRMGNDDDDRWIWSSGGKKGTKTTIEPTIPTVDDRAAFTGDKCPSGQVRFNNVCVDVD